ncbi:hypothetical protein ACU686_10855 [Yinghuangia aomiensis]
MTVAGLCAAAIAYSDNAAANLLLRGSAAPPPSPLLPLPRRPGDPPRPLGTRPQLGGARPDHRHLDARAWPPIRPPHAGTRPRPPAP